MKKNDTNELTKTKPAKTRQTNPERDNKHLAYQTLVNSGVSKTDACKALGYSPNSITALDKRVEAKNGKMSLVCEQNVKAAHRVVKRLMKGKKFGEIESIKDSTALRAAEVVLDRAEPKIGDHSAVSYSFTKVDLTIYQNTTPDISTTYEPT